MPAGLEERRLALEFERLRFERQKIGAELRLRRRELKASGGKAWREIFANPLILAVAGGFLTLMTTTVTNSINASNTIKAESAKARQALQADLIKKFVESPNRETVRTNLSFLVDVGLLPDYASRIRSYLQENPNSAPTASPSGLSEIRTDDDAIDLVISFEGGYADLPTAPGGAVKFGISLSQLKDFIGREVSKDELRDLSPTVAREFYRKLYLENVSSIRSIAVKATYLSMAVHVGKSRAMQITQKAISIVDGKPLPADGVFGPATAALVNSLDPNLLGETMACEWARHALSTSSSNAMRPGLRKRIRAYLPATQKGLCPDLLPAD